LETIFILGDKMNIKRKTVGVSGGFDPIHVGHIRMILDAATHGDVIVILNSDEWLKDKKGYAFMPWEERAEIIRSIRGVVNVISTSDDHDGTVCKTLRNLKKDIDLDYFANGGDRIITNTPEMKVCKKLNIKLLWNIGGGKIQSSSTLVNKTLWGKRRINGHEI
jgi:D-beta-D-heptose 7-phosphate kinase/D-beta-D-heptose 1-phosphate adenosyltransferase